jgi:hypothetical protein
MVTLFADFPQFLPIFSLPWHIASHALPKQSILSDRSSQDRLNLGWISQGLHEKSWWIQFF